MNVSLRVDTETHRRLKLMATAKHHTLAQLAHVALDKALETAPPSCPPVNATGSTRIHFNVSRETWEGPAREAAKAAGCVTIGPNPGVLVRWQLLKMVDEFEDNGRNSSAQKGGLKNA